MTGFPRQAGVLSHPDFDQSRRERPLLLHDLASPPVRLRLRGCVDNLAEALALRAAFAAAHLFGVAAGIHLRALRAMGDPLARALAQAREEQFKSACFAHAIEILGARFDKLPERRRPFYTPRQRFQILELKNLLGWPADPIARLFRVCTHTIRNWEKRTDPDSGTVGTTVRPTPPITRFADLVRSTVQLMSSLGFGSDETTSLVLARAGWKLSPRSVARIRSEKPTAPAPPTSREPHKIAHPVVSRFLNHVWMVDVTEVSSFLGGTFYLASVFDAFSRVPLTLQTYDRKPGAASMARLLKSAARSFGRAKYVITDQGGEFKGSVFRKAAARLGIQHRFGTRDRLFATARLERFWRTLKEAARLRTLQPLTLGDLEQRLETTLTHYLCFRPHQALDGATPAEVFLGTEPLCRAASSPPRGRRGEGPRRTPFTVGFLDPDRRMFPMLRKAA
jgi:transposase InsO family protein